MVKGVEPLHLDASSCWSEKLQKIDDEIQQVLAASHMPADLIELDYQCHPSFFASLKAMGTSHDFTLIRPDSREKLAGLGVRSVRSAYLGGKPAKIGYLHHLRLHPEIRGGHYLARGYRVIRKFFTDNPAEVTLTSILEDNHRARQILENSRQNSSMPVYQQVSRYLTALIPLRGPGKRWPALSRPIYQFDGGRTITTRLLNQTDLPELKELFKKAGQACDGLPCLDQDIDSSDGFTMFPGLSVRDFVGVFLGNRLMAACAIWNQQSFKQIVARKLCASMKLTRFFWRLLEPAIGRCPIPAEGQKVNQTLLDPWAIFPGFEKKLGPMMLQFATREAKQRGFDFAAWGVAEKNPAAEAANSVFFLPYWSIIYQVFWPEHGAYIFGDKQLQLMNLGAL